MRRSEDGGKASSGFVASRLRSFAHAGNGVRMLARTERNAWLHLAATGATVATGIVLRIGASDWRWIVAAIALVWIAEAVNTAVERLCDRVEPGFDPAIGAAKDLAAAAVLIAAMAAALIGLLTLGPPLLGLT